MRVQGLIDTGAILALLDRKDRWHRRCAACLATIRLPLATSLAVLAELFYLLDSTPQHVPAAWRFLQSGAVRVLPIGDDDLRGLEQLMEKYRDRPMDFADATLVHLARRENLTTIFTVDHSDFMIYRLDGRRRFRVLPDPLR